MAAEKDTMGEILDAQAAQILANLQSGNPSRVDEAKQVIESLQTQWSMYGEGNAGAVITRLQGSGADVDL